MPLRTDSASIFWDCGENAGEVDPGDDVSVLRGDAGDAVGVPDVGVDLGFFLTAVGGMYLSSLSCSMRVGPSWTRMLRVSAKVVGVAETEGGGAVAGDDLGGGAGHAPALPVVVELGDGAEGGAVDDEADVGLPGPL